MLKKISGLFFLFSLFFIFGCDSNNLYFEKAVSYQKDGEYQKAIECYNKAITNNDHVAEAEKNLADLCFLDKNYEDAFLHYGNAIEAGSEMAIDNVIKLASFNDKQVRQLASNTLSNIQNEESVKLIFDKLKTILHSKEEYKVIDTLELISNFERDISYISEDIISLLDSENFVIKQKALKVLPKIAKIVCEKEENFNKVLSYLKQDNEIMKSATIDCLGEMKQYAKKAIPELIKLTDKDNKIYKEKVVSSISKIGVPLKEQFVEIDSLLEDKPNYIKITLLETFENIPVDEAKEYVPNILLFLKYDGSEIKQKARTVLTKIGKASQKTVPELVKLLKEQNDEIVSRAIFELGDLGDAASVAIDPLKEVAESTENKDIKKLAIDALQKIQ